MFPCLPSDFFVKVPQVDHSLRAYATGLDGAAFCFSLTERDVSGASLVVCRDETSGDIFAINTTVVTCPVTTVVDRDEVAGSHLQTFAVSIVSKIMDQAFSDRWSDDSGRIVGSPVTGYRI